MIQIDKDDLASQKPTQEVIEAVQRVNVLLNQKIRETYEDVIYDLKRENNDLKMSDSRLKRL